MLYSGPQAGPGRKIICGFA